MTRLLLVLAICWGMFNAQLPQAYGMMVTNQDLLGPLNTQLSKQDLVDLMNRADTRTQLVNLGVDPEFAMQRVNAMTADEVQRVQAGLDGMAAGQDILGLAVLLFIVFVVTDMVGATDIFPFVRCVTC